MNRKTSSFANSCAESEMFSIVAVCSSDDAETF